MGSSGRIAGKIVSESGPDSSYSVCESEYSYVFPTLSINEYTFENPQKNVN